MQRSCSYDFFQLTEHASSGSQSTHLEPLQAVLLPFHCPLSGSHFLQHSRSGLFTLSHLSLTALNVSAGLIDLQQG